MKYTHQGDMMIKTNKKEDYSPETLKHLHEVQLMMLKDFIELCEKYDITYFMDGGSLLGCIRHGGFIPWDDDIDIILFREDYEKFLKYSHELSAKYDIINSDNYEYYCRLYTKLSLKETRNYDFFERNTDFIFGINIDIFVFDNIPNGKIKKNLFKIHYEIFKKFLFLYEITTCDVYLSKNKEKIGHFIRALFKLLHINNKTLKKMGSKLITKSINADSDYIFNLSTSYNFDAFNKNIFKKSKKVKFETLNVNIPLGFDEYLTQIYGNYMEIPPKDKQVNHGFEKIDFGKY